VEDLIKITPRRLRGAVERIIARPSICRHVKKSLVRYHLTFFIGHLPMAP